MLENLKLEKARTGCSTSLEKGMARERPGCKKAVSAHLSGIYPLCEIRSMSSPTIKRTYVWWKYFFTNTNYLTYPCNLSHFGANQILVRAFNLVNFTKPFLLPQSYQLHTNRRWKCSLPRVWTIQKLQTILWKASTYHDTAYLWSPRRV